jgi:predicted Zn-dependent protease
MSPTRFWERREDTSCTTRMRFDDQGCRVSGPEVRASVHERRRDPGASLTVPTTAHRKARLASAAGAPGWRVSASPGQGSVEAVTPEPSWKSRVSEWQAIWAARAGIACWITTTRMHRSYRNSEGVAFGRCWAWTSIQVTCPWGSAVVADGVESLAMVAGRLRSCIDELLGHRGTARPRLVLEASQEMNLLLPPSEASALFHELLGHGAEERSNEMKAGARVGPGCMRVVVRHPWSAFCDDEGVHTSEVVLVADGCLAGRPLVDRASARGSESPSGLAVAGVHAELPRVRCVQMHVQGSGELVDDVVRGAGRVVRCTGVASAEFHHGVAFLAMRGGELWEGGEDTGARVGPFLFRVPLGQLAERLLALPGEVTPARAAICAKARDPMPMCSEAPHALLAGMRVIALPEASARGHLSVSQS